MRKTAVLIIFSLILENSGVSYALRPQATASRKKRAAKAGLDKIERLRKALSITEEECLFAVKKTPHIVEYDIKRVKADFKRELGIGKKKLAIAILRCPQLVSLDIERVKEEFRTKLGVGKAALAEAIIKHPQLAGSSVLDSLKPKMQIIDQMGVAKKERVRGLLLLETASPVLVELIWRKALQIGVEIRSPRALRRRYEALKSCIKKATGAYPSALIKVPPEAARLECIKLIEDVIAQMLKGETRHGIRVPVRLITIAAETAKKQAKPSLAGKDDFAGLIESGVNRTPSLLKSRAAFKNISQAA